MKMIATKSKYLVSLTLLLSMFSPSGSIFAQEAMSSGAYAIQSDSVNFSGVRSTSANYTLEDTLGESGTGDLSSTNFLGKIGYQAMLVSLDTTAPSAPATISATTLSASSIEVTWSAATDNLAVTRYYIYRDGVRIADVATFPRSFVDSGLSANTLYTYNVSAVDDAGNESALSPSATATTFPLPRTSSGASLPLLYNLSIVPGERIALINFDTTTPVRSFIEWSLNGNTLGSLSINELSSSHRFVIPDLLPHTLYSLKITMVRQDGYTVVSDSINFSTLESPVVTTKPNVSSFLATALDQAIKLTWKLPQDPSIAEVRIVRSTNFYPSSPDEGELVFQGLGEEFLDSKVEKGTRYYYTLFVKDIFGNFSSGTLASAIILLPGQEPPPYLPEELDIAGNIDPMIEALTLKDFLFIQDGKILDTRDDKVIVDGTKSLTVALRSYKIPPVLKTIAVTVATQEKNPKYFTFILRINSDGTRYEAVVAPFGETTAYDLKITVVDFQNQGLKKINGTMLVLSEAAWGAIAQDNKNLFIYIFLVLLLCVFIAWIMNRRKKEEEPLPQTT